MRQYNLTHVDDFMIHLWDTKSYMAEPQQLYQIWRIIPISESSSVYLRIAIPRSPHGKQGFILFAHTYLVQALSTARILFDTIYMMTFKEGTLYKMAIIIMMTIAQIFWTDSSTKNIYNSLELSRISTLGRVDITYATRKLARYNAALRVAHWEAAKHVFWTFEKAS